MELSIIIPAYNEEKRLLLTLQRVFEYLSIHYSGDYEVILADDGSTDDTVQITEQCCRQYTQMKILRFDHNRGRGAALRDAVFKTSGDFILEMDADGSVNEHAIVDFLNYFKKHQNVDMLTGSRTTKGSRILTSQSSFRKILGYGFFFLAKLMFGWKFMDRINGFKMFKRETALDIFKHQYENSFFGEAEIVYVAEARGWKVKELPILWTDYKGSKVNPFKEVWRSFFGIFRVLNRDRKGLYSKNIRQTEKIKPAPKKRFKEVLITGGSGFIGSNFIRTFYCNHPDTRIVNLDLLTYAGNLDNLRDIEKKEETSNNKRYFFIQGDICDEALLEKVFSNNKFDLVVHFAAESHVDRSIFSSVDFVRTNIEGTRALIEASKRHSVERFVYISTDEIYGSYENGYATEDWMMNPSNPYAASKAGADLLVQAYIKTYNFPAIIVRGSNNYGPYQYPEKLIPLAITNFLEGKKIPIHGYGSQIRSWVHVDDFCNAIDIIANEELRYNIYNIGGEEESVINILEIISNHMKKNLINNRFHVNDRPGADTRYAVNANRFKSEFGHHLVKKNLNEEIKNIVQWYADNRDWWRKVKEKKDFLEHYERQSKGRWC